MTKALLKLLIHIYRLFISPILPPSCRYHPTCSKYALNAVEQHGSLKGAFLALKRLLRCHPFTDGGYDPVPPVSPVSPASDECSNRITS